VIPAHTLLLTSYAMPETQTVEVRLLNGKRRDVRLSDADDVLMIHPGRSPEFLTTMGLLIAPLRDTYRLCPDPIPRELRRIRDGLAIVGMTTTFHLKARETFTYFQIPLDTLRALLEQAGRDDAEIERWCAPLRAESPKGKGVKARSKPRTSRVEAIRMVIESLTEAETWGWDVAMVAKAARCTPRYFYRCRGDDPKLKKIWKDYLISSRGSDPVRQSEL
jgi:hypothetical protein